MKKYLFLNLIGFGLIITGIAYLMSNQSLIPNLPFFSILPPSSQQQITSRDVSKPVDVDVDTYKGNLVAVNTGSIDINIGSSVKSFDIAQTEDFQGVTYGSLEAGDAVTVNTTKTDLKVGKDVFLLSNKGTNVAKSVYIFR